MTTTPAQRMRAHRARCRRRDVQLTIEVTRTPVHPGLNSTGQRQMPFRTGK